MLSKPTWLHPEVSGFGHVGFFSPLVKRGFKMKTVTLEGPQSTSVKDRSAATAPPTKSTARTGTVFSVTPGLPQLFQSNFDYQLAR